MSGLPGGTECRTVGSVENPRLASLTKKWVDAAVRPSPTISLRFLGPHCQVSQRMVAKAGFIDVEVVDVPWRYLPERHPQRHPAGLLVLMTVPAVAIS